MFSTITCCQLSVDVIIDINLHGVNNKCTEIILHFVFVSPAFMLRGI